MTSNSFAKRGIAFLLCVVMLVSLLPVIQTNAITVTGAQVADDSTMDSWKSFFNPEDISTAHAVVYGRISLFLPHHRFPESA